MISNEQVNTLHEKISKYLELQDSESHTSVTSRIIQLLQENINFDYDELIKAIDEFFILKNSGSTLLYQDKENKIDVSITGSNGLKVKGFTSKGKPALYFFEDDDKKAFFKIKTQKDEEKQTVIVEIANSADALADYKRGINHKELNYIHQEKFVIVDGALTIESSIKTIAKESGDVTLDTMFLCDEYLNFYKFINLVFQTNNQKKITKLTPEKADILFCQFYQTIKNMTGKVDEFSISEIIVLLDSVVNDGKSYLSAIKNMDNSFEKSSLSEVVDEIRMFHLKNCKGSASAVFDFDVAGVKRFFKVVSSDKYMSIDILDENEKKITNYIFVMTNKGFTLFKSVSIPSLNMTRMMTLNMTDNMIKLHNEDRLGNKDIFFNLNMVIEMLENGALILDSSAKCADVDFLKNRVNIQSPRELANF